MNQMMFLMGSDEARSPEEEVGVQPVLRDLALWRIQSATLPGSQAVYHIHVPHYTSMFGELLDRPKPHRFGHMLLPGGSVNLGNPAFELRPGTSAPLVGEPAPSKLHTFVLRSAYFESAYPNTLAMQRSARSDHVSALLQSPLKDPCCVP